jgi:hypothetical protein
MLIFNLLRHSQQGVSSSSLFTYEVLLWNPAPSRVFGRPFVCGGCVCFCGVFFDMSRRKLVNFLRAAKNERITTHAYGRAIPRPNASEHSSLDSRTGISYERIRFRTLASPMLTEFYDLFYPGGVKIVPSNIGDLLTARSLAYFLVNWLGSKSGYGFVLCTHSFTVQEVELLRSVLKEKLNLDTTLQSERGKPRIYIVAGSMNRFRSLVATYFQEAMLYKLR